MKKKASVFWMLLTVLLALAALALCYTGMQGGAVYARIDSDPQEAASRFFRALKAEQYASAYELLEGYSSLGLENDSASEEGALVLAALKESYEFRLVGDCRQGSFDPLGRSELKPGSAVQTVHIRSLDLNKLNAALVASPEEPEGDEGQEVQPPTLAGLLEDPSVFYTERELPVTLHFSDGQWRIVPDADLLSALLGGIS